MLYNNLVSEVYGLKVIVPGNQIINDSETFAKVKQKSKYVRVKAKSNISHGYLTKKGGFYIGRHRPLSIVRGSITKFPNMKCCWRDPSGESVCDTILSDEEYYFFAPFDDQDEEYRNLRDSGQIIS